MSRKDKTVVPKIRKPKSKQAWVVFTCSFLVVLGYVIAIFWVFVFPRFLTWVFPDGIPEEKKIVVTVILGLCTATLSAWFPGVSLRSLIESAIDDAAAAKIREFEKEFEEYRKSNSSDEIIKRLNQEFNALLIEARNAILDTTDSNLNESLRRRIAREVIRKKISENENILRTMATKATKAAFPDKKTSLGKEAAAEQELQLFWQDVFVYLKAWLMFSIENEHGMNVEEIGQQLPNSEDAYIEALCNVKDKQIREEWFTQNLDLDYRVEAIQLLETYLEELITKLYAIRRKKYQVK